MQLPLWPGLVLLSLTAVLQCNKVSALYAFPDCANGPLASNLVCNASAAEAQRATAVVSEFTLAELVSNTVNGSPGVPRLGLPAYNWWSEALVRRGLVTVKSLLT